MNSFYIHIFDDFTRKSEYNHHNQNMWYIICHNNGTVNIMNYDKKPSIKNVSRRKLRDLRI